MPPQKNDYDSLSEEELYRMAMVEQHGQTQDYNSLSEQELYEMALAEQQGRATLKGPVDVQGAISGSPKITEQRNLLENVPRQNTVGQSVGNWAKSELPQMVGSTVGSFAASPAIGAAVGGGIGRGISEAAGWNPEQLRYDAALKNQEYMDWRQRYIDAFGSDPLKKPSPKTVKESAKSVALATTIEGGTQKAGQILGGASKIKKGVSEALSTPTSPIGPRPGASLVSPETRMSKTILGAFDYRDYDRMNDILSLSGTNLTKGQMGGRFSTNLERTVRGMYRGGAELGKKYEEQRLATNAMMQSLPDVLFSNARTPADIAEIVSSAIDTRRDIWQRSAQAMYDEFKTRPAFVDEMGQSKKVVDLDRVHQSAIDLTSEYEKAWGLGLPKSVRSILSLVKNKSIKELSPDDLDLLIADMVEGVENIESRTRLADLYKVISSGEVVKVPEKIGIDQAIAIRSGLIKAGWNLTKEESREGMGLIRKLEGSFDDAIGSAIRKVDPQSYDEWRAINSTYRDNAKLLRGKLANRIKTYAEQNPDEMAKVLFNKEHRLQTGQVKEIIGAGAYRKSFQSWVQKSIDDSITSNTAGDVVFNAGRVRDSLLELGDDVLKNVMTPAQTNTMLDILATVHQTQKPLVGSGGLIGGILQASVYAKGIYSAASADIKGLTQAVAGTGGLSLVEKISTRWLTDPSFQNDLKNVLTLPKGSGKITASSIRLTKAALNVWHETKREELIQKQQQESVKTKLREYQEQFR